MKKKIVLEVAFLSALLGVLATGCGDPCTDLSNLIKDCCTNIKDADAKAACEKQVTAVLGEDGAACQAAVDNYECVAQ